MATHAHFSKRSYRRKQTPEGDARDIDYEGPADTSPLDGVSVSCSWSLDSRLQMICAGDRVAVYDDAKRYVGILQLIQDSTAFVDVPSFGVMTVALKQCRKLVKKARREYWLGRPLGTIERPVAYLIQHPSVLREHPPKFLSNSQLGEIKETKDYEWIFVREVKKP